MRAAFSMEQDPHQQSGITAREAAMLLSTGQVDELMDTIYNKYVEYRKQHDLVVIEGLSGFEPGLGNVNDLNAKIAATLETPVLLVLDSRTKQGFSSANDLANSVVSSDVSAACAMLLLCLLYCFHRKLTCSLLLVCTLLVMFRTSLC